MLYMYGVWLLNKPYTDCEKDTIWEEEIRFLFIKSELKSEVFRVFPFSFNTMWMGVVWSKPFRL